MKKEKHILVTGGDGQLGTSFLELKLPEGYALHAPGLDRLASAQSLGEGQAWGLAIRLCRRFSTGAAQALSNSQLTIEGSQLVLAVREPFLALCTDPVEKDLRNLAEKIGLQPTIRQL